MTDSVWLAHAVSPDLLSLGQELAEIARLVEDDDLETTMRRYVDRIVSTVPGCDHAMITVGTANGLETVAGWIDPDLLQGHADQAVPANPIADVLEFREPRRLVDVGSEKRWPDFTARMADAGFRSALMLPLAATTEPSAVLTLLSKSGDQFADTSYDLVMLFALNAGVAFDNISLYRDSTSLVGHLRSALRTRSTIGQAQGLLMSRYAYTSDRAFQALRISSQHRNIKLRDVASALVEAHDGERLEEALSEYGLDPV
ncbi:GAF and ANTAR domain-containing protein [Pseudonocardia spinosispora]|uniref:GAF and ANTAR domain-containing protein n=1 Tax=Pseudonocardia spinosispora TaxID=103441 RepID=UPI00041BE0B0|nr:GAF and ANTAR domain-containing protein [Pseudonocardia spinosispora]